MCRIFRRPGAAARALLAVLSCGLTLAASPPTAAGRNAPLPKIPDTPAGRALAAWLDAFNSGNRARIVAFDEAHYPWESPDGMISLRARTGGYALLSIGESGKRWIIFRARPRSGGPPIAGKLVVDSHDLGLIWALSLAPAAAATPSSTLDKEQRDRVLRRAARLLDAHYVFPDVAGRLATALRAAESVGRYRGVADGQILAWMLTDDMQSIAHDEHLGVHFSARQLPPERRGRQSAADPAARQRVLAGNCGFEKLAHLAPDIGYLKLDEFDDTATCEPTAAAAMAFLANTDALIIDLRDNHGGRGLVQFILSYFFAKPTHFMDTYSRRDHALHESWTLARVPGRRFIGKPIFVLTSRHTFSAAEAFCYALKSLGRATLVGETTGGGAHPMEVRRIDDHFSISIPVAQSISPITHTDWEGTGITPDIKVPAADALAVALARARDIIRERRP